MVVLGIDAHKRTHTIAVIDHTGKQLATQTMPANDAGHARMLAWARRQWPGPRRWAVEDCRHVTGRLERALLGQRETIVRVPPQLVARTRQVARSRGKSDPIDAVAAARAALAHPDLPAAVLDSDTHHLTLLLDHRSHLVAERTRYINRLRWLLHQLDPDLQGSPALPAGNLKSLRQLRRLHTWLAGQPATPATALATELATTLTALTTRINALHRTITDQITAHPAGPALLHLTGCAHLTAAAILTETAGITRFATADKYAAYNGTAPIPASSGNTTRHRLNRGGNRTLNHALHTIAVTHTRLGNPYQQHLRAQGKTRREALRCLKRKISNHVYTILRQPTT